MYCEDKGLLFFTKYAPFLSLVKIGNHESKAAYLNGSSLEKLKEWSNRSRAVSIVNLAPELFWLSQNRIMFHTSEGLIAVIGK